MDYRKYKMSDYDNLSGWLKLRGMDAWTSEDVPEDGYTVYDDSGLIAIGFLRKIEKRTGMIDGLCTNPERSPEIRNNAIDAVVSRIILLAKELGMDGLLCFSEDKNTLERSKKFGFIEQKKQTIISLNLRG